MAAEPQEHSWMIGTLSRVSHWLQYFVLFHTVMGAIPVMLFRHLNDQMLNITALSPRIAVVFGSIIFCEMVISSGLTILTQIPYVRQNYFLGCGRRKEEALVYYKDTQALSEVLEDTLTLRSCRWIVLRNVLVVYGVFAGYFLLADIQSWREPCAPLWRVWLSVLPMPLLQNNLFYTGHRLLHEVLPRSLHSDHHTVKGMLPYAARYMSLIDVFIETIIPNLAPLVLFRPDWMTAWVWFYINQFDAYLNHSGLDLWPGVLPSARDHWFHHQVSKYNFNDDRYMYGDGLLSTEAPLKKQQSRSNRGTLLSISERLP